MKYFRCDSCGMMVFFQNNRCLKCNHPLGFLPDALDLSALEITADNKWRAFSPAVNGKIYRNCANEKQFQVCNWMVPVEDPDPLCVACRLNETIPDLTDEKNIERWQKLELAKRRCIYTFIKLRLPVKNVPGINQLRFRFLADKPDSPIKTGHQDGLITVNIAEADDDEREHRRLTLHEPYRTLVGHLRHEFGHFYWDRLIANSPNLPEFRKLFGDETVDYGVSLQTYYRNGPATDWQNKMVSAYATAHPWEDWAETWAHYLHIMDTMETAGSFGLSVNPDNAANRPGMSAASIIFNERMDFDQMLDVWIPLTCALNSINRGMGLADLYPFVIPPVVVDKFRFIHQVINQVSAKP